MHTLELFFLRLPCSRKLPIIHFAAEFSKTKTPHNVVICAPLDELLRQAGRDGIIDNNSGPLFPTKIRGGVPSVRQANRVIESAVSLLVEGLKHPLTGEQLRPPRQEFRGVSSHTFRRSRAQFLYYTMDWKLAEVMQITGHKSLAELQRYIEKEKPETDDKYAQLSS